MLVVVGGVPMYGDKDLLNQLLPIVSGGFDDEQNI